MATTYDVGDKAKLNYELKDDETGVFIDATTVILAVTKSDGSVFTPAPTVVHDSLGHYSATFVVDMAGMWLYKFTASGTAIDVTDGQIFVRPDALATVYVTLAELKASLAIPPSDTQDDEELQDSMLSASRWIDGFCQRHFFQITEARSLDSEDPYLLELGAFMDLVSVTTLKTDENGDGTYETTWSASGYQLLVDDNTPNRFAGPETQPYTRISSFSRQFPMVYVPATRINRIEITGIWGWPAIPDAVRRAAKLLASQHFKMKDAPYGAAGIADLGIVRVRDNPMARNLLGPYRKYGVFAL
jgi:hypothetical protein